MRLAAVLALIMLIAACGPTAEVITTPGQPTPPPTDLPTEFPSAVPTVAPTAEPATAPPTDLGSPTPIPLTTPSPGPSESPSPAVTAVPTGFQTLTGFPVSGAYEVTDVTSKPGGFVAVGFGGLAGDVYFGVRQGIVWTSADGINWSQSVDPALANVTPFRVAALGEDVFLFGVLTHCPQAFDETCIDVPEAGNAVWRSTAGGPWTRQPQLADMQLGLIDDVIVAGDRMAVFGVAGDENQTTTIWLGSDGATWTTTTDLAGLDLISSMTAGPGGAGFAAFGTDYLADIEDIILTGAFSSDGLHFAPATIPELPGTAIDDVVAGASGYAGVGYRTGEGTDISGVALHSADGMIWAEATNFDLSYATSGLIEVHPLAAGFVALGFTPHVDDFTVQDGAAWLSADGLDWHRGAPLGGTFTELSATALGSAGLVVFAVEHADVDEENLSSTIHAWFAYRDALAP